MGWEIEWQRVKFGKHSRLWQEEQLYHVFESYMGTPSAVEGISCFINDKERDWSPTMFNRIHSLWLLDINNSNLDLPPGFQYLPNTLKCLIWNNWPLKPSNFMTRNLVELRMPRSKLKKLWSGVLNLGNLKYVDLSCSNNLTDISALSQAPNLVSVDLSLCRRLHQVPPLRFQIGDELTSFDQSSHRCYCIGCRSLGCLKLGSCNQLEVVEKITGNLEKLDLSSTSIKELPSSIWSLDNLEYLKLNNCHNLESLPSDIQKLKSLRVLLFSSCRRLKSLPIGISKFKSLKILDLNNCDQLEIFASTLEHLETLSLSSICHLSSLEKLMLDGSNIEGIPLSIKYLSKLIGLSICYCKRLESLPELPPSLEFLDAKGCILLETILSSRDAFIQGLKSDNHVMTYRRFSYFNCLKLNQNSRKNIISEFQLRVMDTGIKSILPYSVLKKSDCTPGVTICCPGDEIPMWFTYQSKSSSINVKLPSNWQKSNFLGIALCAVAKSCFVTPRISCYGNFKTNYGKSSELQWYFNDEAYLVDFESSNMFMWYKHGNYHDCLDAVEVSFRFSSQVIIGESVTACGIRLLYRQDAEELGITNDLGKSNVVKTGAVNFDTGEPYAKRTKLSIPSDSADHASPYNM